MDLSIKRLMRVLVQTMVVLGVCGCQSMPHAEDNYPPSDVEYKRYSLTLVGMNYTRRYIDQFYVNGQGGGNLFVSTPTSGGGGSVCCVGWSTTTRLPYSVTVKWQSGGCEKSDVTRGGQRFTRNQHRFKEKKVLFSGPVPQNPEYFVVHIYEDDQIEVSISSDYPEPRLRLSPAREDRTPYPPCESEGLNGK